MGRKYKMPNFEDLRLVDALTKFKQALAEVYQSKKIAGFKGLSTQLQQVYDFYITAQNSFIKQEEQLKNLFSSFNYSAVLINNGIKEGKMSQEDTQLLEECFQIMFRCCDLLIDSLA